MAGVPTRECGQAKNENLRRIAATSPRHNPLGRYNPLEPPAFARRTWAATAATLSFMGDIQAVAPRLPEELFFHILQFAY